MNRVASFIEAHRQRFGVEPICRTLGVSASAYDERAKGQRSVRVLAAPLAIWLLEPEKR